MDKIRKSISCQDVQPPLGLVQPNHRNVGEPRAGAEVVCVCVGAGGWGRRGSTKSSPSGSSYRDKPWAGQRLRNWRTYLQRAPPLSGLPAARLSASFFGAQRTQLKEKTSVWQTACKAPHARPRTRRGNQSPARWKDARSCRATTELLTRRHLATRWCTCTERYCCADPDCSKQGFFFSPACLSTVSDRSGNFRGGLKSAVEFDMKKKTGIEMNIDMSSIFPSACCNRTDQRLGDPMHPCACTHTIYVSISTSFVTIDILESLEGKVTECSGKWVDVGEIALCCGYTSGWRESSTKQQQ